MNIPAGGWIALMGCLFFAHPAHAQEPTRAQEPRPAQESTRAAQSPPARQTLVFTAGSYRISIPLPKGWTADTVHAGDFHANVVLYRDSIGLGKDKPVIGIAWFKRNPKDSSMEFQTQWYSKDARMRQIQHEDKAHKGYTYARIVMTDPGAQAPRFISYIDAGPSCDYLFSVILEHDNSIASIDDNLSVTAFLTVL
jgi:hypothetical protein